MCIVLAYHENKREVRGPVRHLGLHGGGGSSRGALQGTRDEKGRKFENAGT